MAEEETKPVVREPQTDELEVVDEGPKRFVSHGPLVIQDTVTGLYWLKKDSWQDRGKYYNWHESIEFAERKNVRKIGGLRTGAYRPMKKRPPCTTQHGKISEKPAKRFISIPCFQKVRLKCSGPWQTPPHGDLDSISRRESSPVPMNMLSGR